MLEDLVAGLLRDDLQPRLGPGEAGLEVEILLDAVAVGPHLPHGFGAEDVLEDRRVDGAGRHGGTTFLNEQRSLGGFLLVCRRGFTNGEDVCRRAPTAGAIAPAFPTSR